MARMWQQTSGAVRSAELNLAKAIRVRFRTPNRAVFSRISSYKHVTPTGVKPEFMERGTHGMQLCTNAVIRPTAAGESFRSFLHAPTPNKFTR